MTDEKLIEEAAKAIRDADNGFDFNAFGIKDRDERWLRSLATAALSVFEKAHAPTDDERRGLIDRAADAFARHDGAPTWQDDPVGRDTALRWHMRGFEDGLKARRSEVPETSAEEDEFAPGECDGSGTCSAPRHIHGCYRPHRADECDAAEEYGHLPAEPQGEPSDAQDATSIALRDWERVGSGYDPLTAGDRLYVALAALRAAGGVR